MKHVIVEIRAFGDEPDRHEVTAKLIERLGDDYATKVEQTERKRETIVSVEVKPKEGGRR